MSVNTITIPTSQIAAPPAPALWSNLDVASIYSAGNVTLGPGATIIGPIGAAGFATAGSTTIPDNSTWTSIPLSGGLQSRPVGAWTLAAGAGGNTGLKLTSTTASNLCLINVQANFTTPTADSNFIRILRQNGQCIATSFLPMSALAGTGNVTIAATGFVDLSNGDVITLEGMNTSGTTTEDYTSARMFAVNFGSFT